MTDIVVQVIVVTIITFVIIQGSALSKLIGSPEGLNYEICGTQQYAWLWHALVRAILHSVAHSLNTIVLISITALCFVQGSVTLSAIDTDHVCLCGTVAIDTKLKGTV